MKRTIILCSVLIGFIFLPTHFASAAQHIFTIEEVPDSPSSTSEDDSSGSGTNLDSSGNVANTGINTATTISAEITSYPREIRISPNTTLDFTITVKNTGNAANISAVFSNNWFISGAVYMQKGETKDIPIALSVPASAQPGPYSVTASVGGKSVSFSLIVTNNTGLASIATIDTEVVRKGIEDVKRRIGLFSGQGYNTTAALELINKAEELFGKGDVLQAGDYVSLANKELDKAVENKESTRTFLAAYVLVGVIVCLIVLLCYYYGRWREERKAAPACEPKEPIYTETKNTETANIQTKEAPDMDDMVRRLEEIRKRVSN